MYLYIFIACMWVGMHACMLTQLAGYIDRWLERQTDEEIDGRMDA